MPKVQEDPSFTGAGRQVNQTVGQKAKKCARPQLSCRKRPCCHVSGIAFTCNSNKRCCAGSGQTCYYDEDCCDTNEQCIQPSQGMGSERVCAFLVSEVATPVQVVTGPTVGLL
jgi:hypothetical protein